MSANIRHSSASNEHYSPPSVIEAARSVLGGIDLDPASSALGNTVVKASSYYDIDADGFTKDWSGRVNKRGAPSRVFLNPPGGRTLDSSGKPVSSQKAWWFKLAAEYTAGRVAAAIFVSFSIELLQTCQVKPPPGLPLPFDFPICFPSRRLAYWKEGVPLSGHAKRIVPTLVQSSSPPHSSMLVYLPPRKLTKKTYYEDGAVDRFVETFSVFGRVIILRSSLVERDLPFIVENRDKPPVKP